jgi:hypothetical protein
MPGGPQSMNINETMWLTEDDFSERAKELYNLGPNLMFEIMILNVEPIYGLDEDEDKD